MPSHLKSFGSELWWRNGKRIISARQKDELPNSRGDCEIETTCQFQPKMLFFSDLMATKVM